MSDIRSGPPRLKEQHDQTNLAERIAGQVARSLPPATPLSATALARISSQIDWNGPAAPRPYRYGWAFATVAFLVGVGTTASAKYLDILPDWLTGTERAVPERGLRQQASPVSARRGRGGARSPVSSSPAASGSDPSESRAELALPAASPDSDRRPSSPKEEGAVAARIPLTPPSSPTTGAPPAALLPASRSRPPVVTPPIAVEKTTSPAEGALAGPRQIAFVDRRAGPPLIAAEPKPIGERAVPPRSEDQGASKFLTEAMQAFRVEHSPKTALRILDGHAMELAKGAFAHEATLLRVEVLLALGRQAEVLRLLDGMSLTGVPASWTLLVTRGELRAAAGRCAEGIGDFDLVLAQAGRPPKRALFGRAFCRKQLGDVAGAAADVERYRREFPGDAAPSP